MIQKRTQVENLTSGFLSTPVFLVFLFTFTPNLKPGWFTLSAQTSGYCYINWFKDFCYKYIHKYIHKNIHKYTHKYIHKYILFRA